MKILLTGATGFLGGKLCAALLADGHSVRALVRPTSDLSSLPPPAAHGSALDLAYGDVTDHCSVLNAASGCHVIFHTAALVDPWLPDPSKFISVNVGGLKNVLHAARETKSVEKIVYTSSIFALGPTDGHVADESQAHDEKFFCSEYERSKLIADHVARQAASEGLPIVTVYPGAMYGPGKLTAGNVPAQMLIKRFNGRLPCYIGNGSDKFPFSHVEDVVQGHIAAMHRGRPGENASFMHVFDMAAIITGTKRPSFHIPLWMVSMYGWVSVFFCRITGKLPLVSPPAVQVLRHQWAYSCDKARAELDYKPRNLREGLEDMLPWLKSLGLIKY
ncbi:hypothetical protein BT93_L3745 [Corymbia citriodora subsp. variegata]|uniref:NAD-dependent epimerase/dehydratase domain-containing protein n=1 Tax=Corymbia citriodora subsp. variegata TaxID=360336 RepID=A0A8T0CZK3_CORYI|nr:hypothetical protein BT93_L3745 [Corymbia citriodora subsp. variegata]